MRPSHPSSRTAVLVVSLLLVFPACTDCFLVECGDHEECDDGDCVPVRVCDTDDQCGFNEYCSHGQCYFRGECRDDSDCTPLDQCESFDCVPRPCIDNSLCPLGQNCYEGTCVAGPCTVDADCPPGQVCDAAVGTCGPGPCVADTDCPPGQVCDTAGGMCVECNGDPDCDTAAGETCVSHVCQAPMSCQQSSAPQCGGTCQPGQQCVDFGVLGCVCQIAACDVAAPVCSPPCALGEYCAENVGSCVCWVDLGAWTVGSYQDSLLLSGGVLYDRTFNGGSGGDPFSNSYLTLIKILSRVGAIPPAGATHLGYVWYNQAAHNPPGASGTVDVGADVRGDYAAPSAPEVGEVGALIVQAGEFFVTVNTVQSVAVLPFGDWVPLGSFSGLSAVDFCLLPAAGSPIDCDPSNPDVHPDFGSADPMQCGLFLGNTLQDSDFDASGQLQKTLGIDNFHCTFNP